MHTGPASYWQVTGNTPSWPLHCSHWGPGQADRKEHPRWEQETEKEGGRREGGREESRMERKEIKWMKLLMKLSISKCYTERHYFFSSRLCNCRTETCNSKIVSWFPDLFPMKGRAHLFETETKRWMKVACTICFCLPWAFWFNFLPGCILELRAVRSSKALIHDRQKVLWPCLLQAKLPRAERTLNEVSLEQFASESLCHRKIVVVLMQ